MADLTPQEFFSKSLQDQKNTADGIKLDNTEILQGIPLDKILSILSKNPNDVDSAIVLLTEDFNERLIPNIRIQGQVMVNQAIETFLDWSKGGL